MSTTPENPPLVFTQYALFPQPLVALMTSITLRDIFAALAASGLCAEKGDCSKEHLAEQAYRMADAMLKARGGT